MATPISSAVAFKRALRDGLRLRAGLEGVTVTNAPVAEPQATMIRFGAIRFEPTRPSTFGSGGTYRESYTLEGVIFWVADGKYEDAALDVAEDAAYDYYGEIAAFLRDTATSSRVTDTVLNAQLSEQSLEPALFDKGTGVVLRFQVEVQNELRR